MAGLLRLSFLLKKADSLIHILLQPVQPLLDTRLRKDHLRRRINRNLLMPFNRTLTVHIKASNRIDFIIPKLNSVRAVIRQIVDIQNAAPDRKLSRPFHLYCPFKPHMDQSFHQILRVINAALSQTDDLLSQLFRRQKTVHQSINGRYHRHWFMLKQFLDDCQSLLNQGLTMYIRTIENNISGRIVKHIPVKKTVIFVDILHPLFAVSHDQLKRILF